MKTEIEIIPYGEAFSVLPKQRRRAIRHHVRISSSLAGAPQSHRLVFVAFAYDLDKSFVELFKQKSTPDSRLLILNEGTSTDRLLSRILDLQIRTPQRFYVLDAAVGFGKTHSSELVWPLIRRIASSAQAEDSEERILDAKVEDGILRVISTGFKRLDIPIAKLPKLADLASPEVQKFEIDEDGSFIYWPKIDLHAGWPQLQQIIDPEAALKARQKSREFNKRYGKAVQKVREEAGLEASDVQGLSYKQLGRIERGECRVTSNAIEALAKAHQLEPNDYMRKLAEAL